MPAAVAGAAALRASRAIVLCALLLAAGARFLPAAVARAAEPANLDQAKAELRRYVESGEYLREVARAAEAARDWVVERAGRRAPDERLAVVLDLDETLLSNVPFMLKQDFGGSDAAWELWHEAAEAPAIRPVQDVYQTARRLGVDVIFLSGRGEHLRAATEKNLRAIGCAACAALVLRPDGRGGDTAEFKTAERRRLVAEGYRIIANLGDQASDLAGGGAERSFKLPGPFYFSP